MSRKCSTLRELQHKLRGHRQRDERRFRPRQAPIITPKPSTIIAERSHEDSTIGQIIWLASYPKSGNTWLRAFIANVVADHTAALTPNELQCYGDAEACAQRFSLVAGKPSTSLTPSELAKARLDVHAFIASESNGVQFVKTHNFNGSIDGYSLINWQVTIGAIYIVRNPLDVIVSMAHHFHLSIDEAITYLNDERSASVNTDLFSSDFISSWSTHVASWTTTAQPELKRVMVVRYEDLLAKPIKYFSKVARTLGFSDHARIARAVQHASFQTLQHLERESGFVEAVDCDTPFFHRGRANQWRSALTRKQIASVIRRHSAQMQRFHYIPSGFV